MSPWKTFHGSEGGQRLQLAITAVVYGLPLIAAFIASLLARPWPKRRAWRVLDPLMAIVALAWAAACVRGVALANQPEFVVSDAFNYWIPIGVYVAMRPLDDVEPILMWVRRLIVAALPLQLAFAAWAYWKGIWGSVGEPFLVLFPAWFLHEGSWLGVITSMVLIIVTKKRALMAASVGVIFLFALLSRRRKLLLAGLVAAACLALVIAAVPALRMRFTILPHETGNFTNLQVRQDEVNGMVRDVRANGWPVSLILGQGFGGTYMMNVGETGGFTKPALDPHHHQTHISPIGWWYRGGIVGALAYAAFFLTAAILAVRATHTARDAALTSSYIAMLVMSLTTFTVPGVPVVTVLVMLVLASGEPQAPRSPLS